MSETTVAFEHVSKRYLLPHQRAGGLRHVLPTMLRRLRGKTSDAEEEFWALRDVSFELKQGDALGVIGPNGAGKSTLLKILAGVTAPTKGRVLVRGRLGALLEVGAGFHPDLTGRENVYLNGSIIGMSRREVERKFDEIVAFSEIERFIDVPVKRYSSGMYLRLAFSVAAHLEPDILLIDEVLAVGDASFRRKCMDRMVEIIRGGRTVLFVSHSIDAVQAVAPQAICLNDGRVIAAGPAAEVAKAYFDLRQANELSADKAGAQATSGDLFARFEVSLRSPTGQSLDSTNTWDDIVLRMDYQTTQRVERPHFTIGIKEGRGPNLIQVSALADGQCPEYIEGEGHVECLIRRLPLMPRRYGVWASVRGADAAIDLFSWQPVATIHVADHPGLPGFDQAPSVRCLVADGAVSVDYEWRFG